MVFPLQNLLFISLLGDFFRFEIRKAFGKFVMIYIIAYLNKRIVFSN